MGYLRYHWFDLVTLVIVVAGLLYGRKRGLSVELVPLIHWFTLIVICGTFCESLGAPIAKLIKIQPNAAFVFVYLLLAVGVSYVFWTIRKTLARGLPGADHFGAAEFPLGAAAAALRFVCILFAGLSLMNASYIPEEELAEPIYSYMRDESEGLQPVDLHRSVFVRSWSGRWLKYSFGPWIINSQPPVEYDSVILDGYHKGMQRAVEGDPLH